MSENIPQTVSKTETLYTVEEAAKKYKVSTITLYRARKAKQLAFYQIGRRVLMSQSHLDNYFASCEQIADN